MNEQANEGFRAQVERLVAEGKLTPEEGQELLGEPEGMAAEDAPENMAAHYTASGEDTPPDLHLDVSGFTLRVVLDSGVVSPQLHASEDGKLLLEARPDGWRVARRPGQEHIGWSSVSAVLSLPFSPRHVRARVSGGNVTLPDLGGELVAQVSGGNVRAGRAASLQAEVSGGNLTAAELSGPTQVSVNGGNLSLEGARTLNATVNGGHLKWAGCLTGGEHRAEVNGGSATLRLLPGSSVTVEADVTVGSFKADFPTERRGSFMTMQHTGRLGAGEAHLSCRATAGQIKVVTA